MFTENLFEYDEANHIGYYCGKIVPSITQLIEAIFPIDPNIPTSVLKKAADKGTQVHELIQKFNEAKDNEPLNELLKNADVQNYYAFLKALDFFPKYSEKLVFLRDEKGDLIAYGHFDFILECLKENMFGEENQLVLGDLKTTSVLDKKKVHLQTELYRVAAMQTLNIKISEKTFALHLRDGKIKFYPFLARNEKDTILLAQSLKELWKNA